MWRSYSVVGVVRMAAFFSGVIGPLPGAQAWAAGWAVAPDGHPNSPAYGHLKLPHLN